MLVDWEEVKKAIYPIKDYEALSRRWQESFAYAFVRTAYNMTMPDLATYTHLLLNGDPRGRYTDYAALLLRTCTALQQADVQNVLDLLAKVETRAQLAHFAEQRGICAQELAALLKYLIYWFIPMKKLLSSLARDDAGSRDAIKVLRGLEVRTNLDLLQQGLTAAGRKTLTAASGLPASVLAELINRADFSRLPWASKATISNIMGAGYGSLAQLAAADPEQLYADFFRYGKAIGKNLKLGNEIENSYRIAQIVPVLLQGGEETDQSRAATLNWMKEPR